ncbi:c-type cytochrome [Bradyrhizobium elkanii]
MTGQLRIITGIAAIVLVAGAAMGLAVARRPQIAAIAPPRADTFDPDAVKRGRELAAIGNCNTCHTVQGGATYAGGLPVPTPFGIVFSSNITPDAETGIGRWPEEAFVRAMRSGVARDGQHLYPTFPYDHFTNVSDADDRALYAFLMTRQPVHASPPANQLSFPFNYRPLIAGWKLLYLRGGDAPQDSAKGAEWNRGAYLVEGLAHCGACHTRAQRAGRRARQCAVLRRRGRQLACLRAERHLARPGAVDRRRALRLFAPWLAGRSWHRARADG